MNIIHPLLHWLSGGNFPPTLAALLALGMGIWNHKQGIDIHLLVNSNLASVKAELESANKLITTLIADRVNTNK